MKTMISKRIVPTKPKATLFKSAYKVRYFIRMYSDRTHPEQYVDKEVKTRTARPSLLEAEGVDAYQFYSALEVTHLGVPIDPTLTAPRDFSKLHFNNLFETEE